MVTEPLSRREVLRSPSNTLATLLRLFAKAEYRILPKIFPPKKSSPLELLFGFKIFLVFLDSSSVGGDAIFRVGRGASVEREERQGVERTPPSEERTRTTRE